MTVVYLTACACSSRRTVTRLDRDHLRDTERHIREPVVATQKELVNKVEGDAYDIDFAILLLQTLERSLQLHIEAKELVLSELHRTGWAADEAAGEGAVRREQ